MINVNEATPSQLQALYGLKAYCGGAVLGLIKQEIENVTARLVRADELATIHRLQGRIEALENVLQAVEEAPVVLNRA